MYKLYNILYATSWISTLVVYVFMPKEKKLHSNLFLLSVPIIGSFLGFFLLIGKQSEQLIIVLPLAIFIQFLFFIVGCIYILKGGK